MWLRRPSAMAPGRARRILNAIPATHAQQGQPAWPRARDPSKGRAAGLAMDPNWSQYKGCLTLPKDIQPSTPPSFAAGHGRTATPNSRMVDMARRANPCADIRQAPAQAEPCLAQKHAAGCNSRGAPKRLAQHRAHAVDAQMPTEGAACDSRGAATPSNTMLSVYPSP